MTCPGPQMALLQSPDGRTLSDLALLLHPALLALQARTTPATAPAVQRYQRDASNHAQPAQRYGLSTRPFRQHRGGSLPTHPHTAHSKSPPPLRALFRATSRVSITHAEPHQYLPMLSLAVAVLDVEVRSPFPSAHSHDAQARARHTSKISPRYAHNFLVCLRDGYDVVKRNTQTITKTPFLT